MTTPAPTLFFAVRNKDSESSAAIERLLSTAPAHRRSTQVLHRTYYDTFDWRLERAGIELATEPLANGKVRVHIATEPPLAVEIETEPAFASAFPRGPLRERLGAWLGPRRLLPRVVLEGQLEIIELLDDESRTRLRIEVQSSLRGRNTDLSPRSSEAVVAPTPRALLRPRIWINATTGHEEDAARAAHLIKAVPVRRQLSVLLPELGVKPQDPGKPAWPALAPETPAGIAARRLLLPLLDNFEAQLWGLRHRFDIEFLHDLRVATRRSRSILLQLKSCLPPESVERFAADLRWIGQRTGPARDLDVWIEEITQQVSPQPTELSPGPQAVPSSLGDQQAGLRVLLTALETERDRMQVDLISWLDEPRLLSFRLDWRRFLEGASDPAESSEPAENEGARADAPIAKLLQQRVRRLLRRMLRVGTPLTANAAAEGAAPDLHRLRLDAKKLRYLIELRAALPARRRDTASLSEAVKSLKKLQDVLGAFNDAVVQQAELRRWARRLEAEAAPALTLLELGRLLERAEQRERASRNAFAAHFKSFAKASTRKRIEGLFKVPHTAGSLADKDRRESPQSSS